MTLDNEDFNWPIALQNGIYHTHNLHPIYNFLRYH